MASASLRIYARRFLQELFLDAPFSEIYEEPLNLLTNQSNPDNEDGTCCDKVSIGSETVSSEDYPVEANNWKTSGPKINGFDSEPRSGQGYELEVILESDARSESSDVCRLSGEGGRGSITPLEPKTFPEDRSQSSRKVGDDCGQSDDGLECHLTVSRSSQQLRKEFFNSALSNDSKSNLEKDFSIASSPEVKNTKHDESFASKVADSITKSQGMLEPKLPNQEDESATIDCIVNETLQVLRLSCNEIEEDTQEKGNQLPVSISNSIKIENKEITSLLPVTSERTNEDSEKILSLGDKDFSKVEGIITQSGSFDKTYEKLKVVKGTKPLSHVSSTYESSTTLSNVSKSPQTTKKEKKANNSKALSITGKTEACSTNIPAEQSTVQNLENCNQRKENVSPKVNNDLKVDALVGKKYISKIQGKSPDATADGSSSSKVALKNTKLKTGDPTSSSGKPPSGLGRQRKKATSKTPNRDNLDSVKKKTENESR